MTFDPMTFDEARLMANVNARAQSLFEIGYRARWIGGSALDAANQNIPVLPLSLLQVRSPKEAVYCLDTQAGTCDCPFFQGHAGRHPCKHLLGWERLLRAQRSCRLFVTLALLRAWADLDDGAPCRRPEETPRPVPGRESVRESAEETEDTHAYS